MCWLGENGQKITASMFLVDSIRSRFDWDERGVSSNSLCTYTMRVACCRVYVPPRTRAHLPRFCRHEHHTSATIGLCPICYSRRKGTRVNVTWVMFLSYLTIKISVSWDSQRIHINHVDRWDGTYTASRLCCEYLLCEKQIERKHPAGAAATSSPVSSLGW